MKMAEYIVAFKPGYITMPAPFAPLQNALAQLNINIDIEKVLIGYQRVRKKIERMEVETLTNPTKPCALHRLCEGIYKKRNWAKALSPDDKKSLKGVLIPALNEAWEAKRDEKSHEARIRRICQRRTKTVSAIVNNPLKIATYRYDRSHKHKISNF